VRERRTSEAIHLRNSFLVSPGILQFTYETRSSFLREYYNSPTKLVPRFSGNTTIHLRNSFLVSPGILQFTYETRSSSLLRLSGNTTIHLRNSFIVSPGILQKHSSVGVRGFTFCEAKTRSSFLREYYKYSIAV
jgi:hypothetical protein